MVSSSFQCGIWGLNVGETDDITGNAHFSFMEMNNLQIVPFVERWMRKHV